jgi:DNA polymerase III subunit epsilon
LETTDLDDMAKRLEASGAYRVLKRLTIPAAFNEADGTATKLGIVLDVETTGLNSATDQIIELGIIKFEFSAEGRVFRVVDRFSGLREPTVPMPAEIVELTGITPELLDGREISSQEVSTFIADAVIVIAHNAAFDRPFCEREWPDFAAKHWACSSSEVAWHRHGHAGSRLAYLLNEHGYFADGHRAMTDCEAVLTVLSRSPNTGGTYLGELLANARRSTVRLFAEGAPFEGKDTLKARGYRWFEGNGDRPKSWRKDLYEDVLNAELAFLKANIFGGKDVELPVQRFSATDRYSVRAS